MAEDDEDQSIGFQDPDQEDMPSEMKDHWLAAFRHEAGLGPHPGPYTGPKRKGRDPDEPTESDRESARQEEANASKMRAAAMGGSLDLGPSQMEQQAVKQQNALMAQQTTQGAQTAQQAQAAQVPNQPPPAPSGPAGVSQPYPAQRGPQGLPDVTAMPPAQQEQGQQPPPGAPGQAGQAPGP